jgi:hypothetical protein
MLFPLKKVAADASPKLLCVASQKITIWTFLSPPLKAMAVQKDFESSVGSEVPQQ